MWRVIALCCVSCSSLAIRCSLFLPSFIRSPPPVPLSRKQLTMPPSPKPTPPKGQRPQSAPSSARKKAMDPEVWERLIKPIVPPTKVEISSLYDDCKNCSFAPTISESAKAIQSEGFMRRLPASVERFRELHNAVPTFAKNDRTFTFRPQTNSSGGISARAIAARGNMTFLARVQEDLRLRQERAEALARASACSFHPQLSSSSSASGGDPSSSSGGSSSSRPASPARSRHGSRRGSFLERLTKDLENREELAREQQRARESVPFAFQPQINTTEPPNFSKFLGRMTSDITDREEFFRQREKANLSKFVPAPPSKARPNSARNRSKEVAMG